MRETHICEICGRGTLLRELPLNISSTTYEVKDKLRGIQHPKNLEKQLKVRMNNHHDRHEIEEKIDRHGLNDAKKFGWTKKVKRV